MGNIFGKIFRLATFGESHGPAVGGIVDGCPAGIALAEEALQKELDARRPGRSPELAHAQAGVSPRNEPDHVSILSGVFNGLTTGAPIAFEVKNTDARPGDYDRLREVYRPGHADASWQAKFGIRDHRGGGRASARETVARVAGGAVALALLATKGIMVRAFTLELGGICATPSDIEGAAVRPYFSPDPTVISRWDSIIRQAAAEGDSLGGIVAVEALGVPAGLGEPVFDKLDACLAYALMGVGAVKGVEIGAGFPSSRQKGSANNDQMSPGGYLSNNCGGILGGVSTGETISIRAAVKPIPTIAGPQKTIDVHGAPVSLECAGRHDISAIPRIVPVLKAMAALTLADALLLQRRMR